MTENSWSLGSWDKTEIKWTVLLLKCAYYTKPEKVLLMSIFFALSSNVKHIWSRYKIPSNGCITEGPMTKSLIGPLQAEMALTSTCSNILLLIEIWILAIVRILNYSFFKKIIFFSYVAGWLLVVSYLGIWNINILKL